MELEFGLELGEQLLPGFHCTFGGFGELGEQLVHLGGTGLHECAKGHGIILLACRGSQTCDLLCGPMRYGGDFLGVEFTTKLRKADFAVSPLPAPYRAVPTT